MQNMNFHKICFLRGIEEMQVYENYQMLKVKTVDKFVFGFILFPNKANNKLGDGSGSAGRNQIDIEGVRKD